MSVELYLKLHDHDIAEVGYMRNPFGLPTWATDNANYYTQALRPLYDIIDEQDRVEFTNLVRSYKDFIMNLNEGYFFFNTRDLIAFLEPDVQHKCNNFWTQTVQYNDKLGIPMDWFNYGLAEYKDYFMKLVVLSDLYQNPETVLIVDK